MCYNNAAAQQAEGISALRHGILVLLFPPLALFSAILGLAWSRNRRFNRSNPLGSLCDKARVAAPTSHAMH